MDKRDFFKTTLHVSDDHLVTELVKISEPVNLKKGEILLRQGAQQLTFTFLVEGIFRGFYLDVNGKEVTDCFGFQSGTPAMSAALNNHVSPITIETVVASSFIRLDAEKLVPMIYASPLLLKIYNEMLQQAMQLHWELKLVVSQRTALERYQWFLEKYPGLIDQVNGKHIASYLGMTPVTLSRIRRVMREGS